MPIENINYHNSRRVCHIYATYVHKTSHCSSLQQHHKCKNMSRDYYYIILLMNMRCNAKLCYVLRLTDRNVHARLHSPDTESIVFCENSVYNVHRQSTHTQKHHVPRSSAYFGIEFTSLCCMQHNRAHAHTKKHTCDSRGIETRHTSRH